MSDIHKAVAEFDGLLWGFNQGRDPYEGSRGDGKLWFDEVSLSAGSQKAFEYASNLFKRAIANSSNPAQRPRLMRTAIGAGDDGNTLVIFARIKGI